MYYKKSLEQCFPKGIKVDDKDLEKINLTTNNFRGDWNYKISP
jgi:hypothetical protein